MDLEVLVATMGQEDCSLAEKMNIQSSAVIANQCGRWGYTESTDGKVRMISTGTTGVGINRNFALQLAKADILLFADDDITYYDGAMQGVLDAFRQFPDADVILFGMDMTRNGAIYEQRNSQTKRAHIWNSMKYGTYRIAVRRQSLLKHNIWFSTLFGGGCKYGCGEDSILLCDCFRAGLKVYSHSHVLGTCAKDKSSWFSGYNEKYFFDRGAMLACAFKRTKHVVKWYYIWKFSKKTEIPFFQVIRKTNEGIRAFRNVRCFENESQKRSST